MSRGPDWRTIGSFAAALVVALALASTLFTREDGVDPRPLLIALGAVIAAVPLRRLVAALPLEDERVPSLRPARTDPSDGDLAPASLAAWIGRVNGGTSSARAATLRLIPGIREIARVRLADRTGISLDHSPEAAAAALGPVAWALIRPDAPRNVEASMPGLRVEVVDEVVTTLERL